MSMRAKLTLAGTTVSATAIVLLVHYQQKADKAVSGRASPPIYIYMD